MKKNLQLIGVLFALVPFKLLGQCTPDSNMPKGSILPESIKYAYLNSPYTEIIYYRAPSDTVTQTPLGQLPVQIDSMEITGVSGLPATFSYQCNSANCRFMGGEAGCLTVSGTPTTTGVYPLMVYIRTYATIKGFVDLPVTQNDSNARFVLYVFGQAGQNESEINAVEVYPNPAQNVINVKPYTNGMACKVKLTDMSGRVVKQIEFDSQTTIDISAFEKGMYLLLIEVNNKQLYRKITLQ